MEGGGGWGRGVSQWSLEVGARRSVQAGWHRVDGSSHGANASMRGGCSARTVMPSQAAPELSRCISAHGQSSHTHPASSPPQCVTHTPVSPIVPPDVFFVNFMSRLDRFLRGLLNPPTAQGGGGVTARGGSAPATAPSPAEGCEWLESEDAFDELRLPQFPAWPQGEGGSLEFELPSLLPLPGRSPLPRLPYDLLPGEMLHGKGVGGGAGLRGGMGEGLSLASSALVGASASGLLLLAVALGIRGMHCRAGRRVALRRC